MGLRTTDLLGIVSHELRSPLAVMVGLAAMLADHRRELTEEQIDDLLNRIRHQGDRLATLIDDLLDVSSLEAGRLRVDLRPVQLAQTVRRALEDAPPPRSKSVVTSIPEDVWVTADSARLEQVVVNLLTNAYRYGGLEIAVRAEADGDGFSLTMSDNGPGVPEAHVPHLFEQFSRGDNVGTHAGSGLGLSIVRGIVEASGGRVSYERGSPTGACFKILLRRGDPPDRRPGRHPVAGLHSGGMTRILVVDDEPEVRLVLRTLYEHARHEVVEAANGAVALQRVADFRPDLVVTDLGMPVMDGRELIERLRSNPETAAIPILVLGGSAESTGADAAVGKPLHPTETLEASQRLLARKP